MVKLSYYLTLFSLKMIKNYFINMQKGFLLLMSVALLFSCSAVEPFDALELVESQERIAIALKNASNSNSRQLFNVCGNDVTQTLLAGKTIPIGEVTAYNDDENLYIIVSIDGDYTKDWFIQKLHMYIGQVAVDFSQKVGNKNNIVNPSPGKFPYNPELSSENQFGVQEYTWTLPITEDMFDFGEFDIAVQADVVRVKDILYENGVAVSGQIAQKESAWAAGLPFSHKGNWATYFSFTITSCEEGCNPSWSRKIEISSNGKYADSDGVLKVTYRINGRNQRNIGEVVVERSGSKTHPDGFTYKMTFLPNQGVSFRNIKTCVSATQEDGDIGNCSAIVIPDENFNFVYHIINAPYTSTGEDMLAASSWVHLTLESNLCDSYF